MSCFPAVRCAPLSLSSPLRALLMFESPSACDQCHPLLPPLPVGNQQTGRCEWTVKLYSAACQLPGGRYAITSQHALCARCPLHSASMSLCSCSCSAAVQTVVAMVVIGGVRFASILSPFPLEDIEGRSLLVCAPISPRRALFPSLPARPVEGLENEGT